MNALLTLSAAVMLFPSAAFAASPGLPDLTSHWVGYAALAIFGAAYMLVIAEETTHLRKSKPVVVAAGILWVLIALVYGGMGRPDEVEGPLRHVFLEYAELLLFLLVAMTYVNALEERRVFDTLRAWLIRSGFSYRKLFWLTGVLAFFISPVADNLTTALVMCAVVLAVGKESPLRRHIVRQHRRRRQRRWCLQPVRRHHHPDGVAEGNGSIRTVLRLVPALRRELCNSRRPDARGRAGRDACGG